MAEPKSTVKLDFMRTVEADAQKLWKDNKVFELNPVDGSNSNKYMATFPYPYMNGKAHIGHSFSLSKLEVSSVCLVVSIFFLKIHNFIFSTVCNWL